MYNTLTYNYKVILEHEAEMNEQGAGHDYHYASNYTGEEEDYLMTGLIHMRFPIEIYTALVKTR